MALTHTVIRQYRDQSPTVIFISESVSGNTEANFDDAALPVAVNTPIAWSCTRSELQSVCLSASAAVTVYTNAPSSGAPQDTIVLSAGQVLCWTLAGDGLSRCPFAGNVTGLYVTNAGLATVAFKVRALLTRAG